jgi:dihydrofolate reductase
MRELVLKMSISVDGFVCGPDGELDWIFNSMDDESKAWTVDKVSRAGLHIMGSRTFHDMRSYWPSSTEVFADPMNNIPKAVFTRKGTIEADSAGQTTPGLEDAVADKISRGLADGDASQNIASWNNAYVAAGDISDEIRQLKAQPGKYIMAHGGAGFAQSLVATGLVDEYQLLIHPAVLGKGKPIFSELVKPLKLGLIESKVFKTGARACVYRPT